MKLLLQAILKLLSGLGILVLLLFLPAGTLKYPNGWLFLGLLFIPMIFLGAVLWVKAPQLLAKRLKNTESQKEQKTVVALSGLLFLAGFILSGLDFRFQWLPVPRWGVAAASVLLLFSYGLYAEVMRENTWLSRTVEIQEDQKVIDTGLYGIVRHPMYMASTLLFLSFPLVLGSGVAFVLFLCYPFLLVKRIKNEEKVLEEGLSGYRDYQSRVRYRMFPFIW